MRFGRAAVVGGVVGVVVSLAAPVEAKPASPGPQLVTSIVSSAQHPVVLKPGAVREVVVTNDGRAATSRLHTSLRAPSRAQLEIARDRCRGTVLAPDRSCTITVRYAADVPPRRDVSAVLKVVTPGTPKATARAHFEVVGARPPKVGADAYAVVGGAVLTVAAPGLLANDTGTGPLTAQLDQAPSHGDLELAADGSFVYRPESGYAGTDSFTYRAVAPSGAAATGTATITVTDPPVAVADQATADEDVVPNTIAGDVLANDTGDQLTVTNAGSVTLAHGALVLQPDGSWTYTLDNADPAVNALDSGQTLTDTYTYTVTDEHGGTASATLTVTVRGRTDAPANRAPHASADAKPVTEDAAPNPVSGNVLTNDSDADGHTISVTNAGTYTLTYGVLEIHADGTWTYTLDNANPTVNALNDGQTLTDDFTYTVSDGHGGTDTATLTVTINGTTDNQAPSAGADTATVREDTAPNPVSGNVLTNDSDADGHTISVTNAGTYTLTYGVLVIHADGTWTYTLDNANPTVNALNDGQTLTDDFTYTVSDGHGGTDTATLTVTINGTTDNQPPTALADTNTIREDSAPNPVSGNVLTNDFDADGHTLSVITTGTFVLSYGVLVINADGTYTYTLDNANPAVNALDNGQSLTDTFTYTVSDGHGAVDSAVLGVRINGTTD